MISKGCSFLDSANINTPRDIGAIEPYSGASEQLVTEEDSQFVDRDARFRGIGPLAFEESSPYISLTE
jgi:hypothetical protein